MTSMTALLGCVGAVPPEGEEGAPSTPVTVSAPRPTIETPPKPGTTPPRPTTTVYEAEDARTEGVAISTHRRQFSGSGYVEFDSWGASGAVEFTVQGGGPAELELRLAAHDPRTHTLSINGVVLGGLQTVAPTGQEWTALKLEVVLRPGPNSVRITATRGPDVDQLIVRGVAAVPAAVAATSPATAAGACDAEARIFRPRCGSCHGAAAPDLTSPGLWARLVDRPGRSVGNCGTRSYIVGSAPTTGFLYERLRGDTCGPRMPPDGALSAADLECITSWASGQK